MLQVLPSVFVNNTAKMILPNRIASGDGPNHRDRRCLRFCHLEHRSPTSQPLRRLRISLTTPASHHSVPRTSAVGLKSAPTSCCIRGPTVLAIPESKHSGSLHIGFPFVSLNKTSAPLPCEGKTATNCVQSMYIVILCLSLDAEMQKCHVIMRRVAERSVQLH